MNSDKPTVWMPLHELVAFEKLCEQLDLETTNKMAYFFWNNFSYDGYEEYKLKQMDNKYFTPSVEDIRVGYECEIQSSWGWQKGKWPQVLFEDTLTGFDAQVDLTKATTNANLRVPYLTKEQIEAEGWKGVKKHTLELTEQDQKLPIFYKNGHVLLFAKEATNSISSIKIMFVAGVYPSIVNYFGQCKDINTLRYICKLLNIK